MIYITSALVAESSFIIDDFQLKKSDDTHFCIYENAKIKLIISGIGKINAAVASTYLLQKYQATKEDKVFNIGTCTSTKSTHPIGEVHQIKKLIDLATNQVYHLPHEGSTLTCVDKALEGNTGIKSPLADMESVGFYLAAKRFIKNEHIMIVKVISDEMESKIPKSDDIKRLFSQHSKTIGALLS